MKRVLSSEACFARKSLEGFSLVEVVVAVLVLSVGLLGVASLLLKGVSLSHDSHLRTQATYLMQDIVDRIHLNSSDVSYVGTYFGLHRDDANDIGKCVHVAGARSCSAEEVKRFDLESWRVKLADSLPGAQAQIEEEVVDGNVFLIVRVAWADVGTDASADFDDAERAFVASALKL